MQKFPSNFTPKDIETQCFDKNRNKISEFIPKDFESFCRKDIPKGFEYCCGKEVDYTMCDLVRKKVYDCTWIDYRNFQIGCGG